MLDLNSCTVPELVVIAGSWILGLTPHSKYYINEQKNLVKQLNLRKEVREFMLKVLDSIETTEE